MPVGVVGKVQKVYGIQSTPRGVSAVHYVGRCYLNEVLVETDGVNDVAINIWDNNVAVGAGTRVGNPAMTITAATRNWAYTPPKSRLMKKGIYIEITCAGTCYVSADYDPGT